MDKNLERSLTDGSVTKNLLLFSLPLMLSTFLQALLNVADMIIVARYAGTVSAVAVGIGGQISFLIVNAVVGLGAGGTILISQYFGAKKMDDLKNTINTMLSLYIVLAIVITIIMLFLTKPILYLLKTPPDAIEQATNYVIISMFGLIFIFIYNGISAILRGIGDSRHPLIFIAIACVCNFILDYIAVVFLHLGASGTALATVISQAISVIISIVFLKRRNFIFSFKKFRIKFDKIKLNEILKLGVPTAIQNSMATLSFLSLTYIINIIGGANAVYSSCANAMAGKYNGFAILPARAMSSAVASMGAQNVGAGKLKRVKKTVFIGIIISTLIGLFFVGLTWIFTDQIFSIFGADALTKKYGRSYMRAFSFEYAILPITVCLYGLLDGFGLTKTTMIINIITTFFMRVPIAYILGIVLNMGMIGVGLSIPIASFFGFIIITIVVLRKRKTLFLDY